MIEIVRISHPDPVALLHILRRLLLGWFVRRNTCPLRNCAGYKLRHSLPAHPFVRSEPERHTLKVRHAQWDRSDRVQRLRSSTPHALFEEEEIQASVTVHVQRRILFDLPIHETIYRPRGFGGRNLRIAEHSFQHRQRGCSVFNLLPPSFIAVVMAMYDLPTKATHREGFWIQRPDRVSYFHRWSISIPHVKSINETILNRHGYSRLGLEFHLMSDALFIEVMIFRIEANEFGGDFGLPCQITVAQDASRS